VDPLVSQYIGRTPTQEVGFVMSTNDSFELCGLRSDQELDHRQREVLSALSEEQKATYSFQGLRRKLGLHQEMLSRTLDRLEEQDLVERTEDGYRISFDRRASRLGNAGSSSIETRVVTAYLPHQVDQSLILRSLKGRWFSEFRWLGYSVTPSGLTMSWISDDGRVQLRAKLLDNTLMIDAIYGSAAEKDRAMNSAFELFDLFTDRTSAMSQVAS
jgi:DNA-binding transcriptional ArsR family regulator